MAWISVWAVSNHGSKSVTKSWERMRVSKAIKQREYSSLKSFLSIFALSCLCLFLVSFSAPTRTFSETPKSLSPVSSLLSHEDLLKADPSRHSPWSLFKPSWASKISFDSDPFESRATDFELLLDDPSNRLEAEFRIPLALRGRVKFWLDIFGRYPSEVKIIHDRNNPEVVFGLIDLRPHFRSTSSLATAAYRSSQTERAIIRGLQARIKEAAGLTNTQLLTDFEKESLKQLIERTGGLDTKNVRRLLRHLRTQTGQRNYFVSGLERSQILLPQIEKIFRDRGLPLGLTRIPFVESSFNPEAYSKVGAMGLWQFVRETARQMIHESSEMQWRDPIAQSRAAAKLLELYRNVLPDWGMAITAYNSGVGRMRRLSQKYDVENVEEFGKIPATEDFGFAGRNFFAEVLAVNLLVSYKDIVFEREIPPAEAWTPRQARAN